MPAATRLLVVFLALVGAFLALVGVAAASLFTAGQQALAAVVAAAGLAGAAAGGVTYWMLRRDVLEDEAEVLPLVPLVPDEPPPARKAPARPRAPLRVQSMPVANLPPAYVDAVLRGAQARLSAIKGNAPAPSASGPAH